MNHISSNRAHVIVIGGGIFGCSIAYYYSRNNPGKKIILFERNELCNAATSRAAALVTRVRSKKHFIPLSLETYRVIPELEKLLGESLDMKCVGVMHVAASEARVKDLDQLMKITDEFGLPSEYISPDVARKKSPWLRTEEVLKVGFLPGEAYCDPYLLGSFFARGAKIQGAALIQDTEVEALIIEEGQAVGIKTAGGDYFADKIIIAAGAWSPILAMQAGVSIPMAPVRSQYWITEKGANFPMDAPIVLLPDASAYARPEGGALLFGIREKESMSISPREIPGDISKFSFSPDRGMHDLTEQIERLARFFPGIYDVGLPYYIAGFSAYTPDNNLSMGEAPGVNNLLLATGCAGAGISVSGGVGLAFAELAAGNPNPFDFSNFSLDRFGKIDPFSHEWLQKCALARSGKLSG